MRNVILFCTLLLGMFLLSTSHVFACVCAGDDFSQSAIQELLRSKAVFSGEVTDIRTFDTPVTIGNDNIPSIEYTENVTFAVETPWKGISGKTVMLQERATSCSVFFQKGEKYLVYARASEDDSKNLYTTICTRTKQLTEAQGDVFELTVLNTTIKVLGAIAIAGVVFVILRKNKVSLWKI